MVVSFPYSRVSHTAIWDVRENWRTRKTIPCVRSIMKHPECGRSPCCRKCLLEPGEHPDKHHCDNEVKNQAENVCGYSHEGTRSNGGIYPHLMQYRRHECAEHCGKGHGEEESDGYNNAHVKGKQDNAVCSFCWFACEKSHPTM